MSKIKKWNKQLCALACIMMGFSVLPVQAIGPEEVSAENEYVLVDFASETIVDSRATFKEARKVFDEQADGYDNLGIVYNGTTLQVEYGIMYFNTDEACTFTVPYVNAVDESEGEINGCSGKDAAYLRTDEDGEHVEFMISSMIGWASIEDVEIVPVQNIAVRLSAYVVEDGYLYHEIKSQTVDDYYAAIISYGTAPEFLQEGNTYYSYDGHYFYSSSLMWTMLEDYRNSTHENAINAEDPYYNYYQFVSHRTLSSADCADAEDLLNERMGVQGRIVTFSDEEKDGVNDTLTRSQYYGNLEAFWEYQYEYGANALMQLAISGSESMYGRGTISFTRNNVFSHAAYDDEQEAAASRYNSINKSIYSNAKYYISGGYASPLKSQFHGSCFGNLATGMNVMYSDDPYWGEKVAAYYADLDEKLGGQDNRKYTLGIRTLDVETRVFAEPDNRSMLYTTGKMHDFSFVILDTLSNEYGDWFVIQSEATMDENQEVDLSYYYDYKSDVAYIRQEAIQYVLEAENEEACTQDFVRVTFEGDGGVFEDGENSVSYELPVGSTAYASAPKKDHALFTGWDSSLENLQEDTTVTAQYKDVESIELKSKPKTDYEVDDRIDLAQGVLQINFVDGSVQEKILDTDMVKGFDLSVAGDQEVIVTYAGCEISYPIYVSQEKDDLRAELKSEIKSVIELYSDQEEITGEDAQRIIKLKEKIDANMQPYLTQVELRAFDRISRLAYQEKVLYIVDKNDYELGVSGLAVSVPLNDSLEKKQFFKDCYRIKIKQGIGKSAASAMEKQAEFSNNSVVDTFTIRLLKNWDSYYTHGPLVYSIDRPLGADPGDVFTVLYYDEDTGDVVQCYTRQTSEKITFMANRVGEFMLISRRTSNVYAGEDPIETVTQDSNSYDMEFALVYASIGVLVLLIVVIVLYFLFKKFKERHVEKHREIVQEKSKKQKPLEVTQALDIINTKVLSLDEIREAEKEGEDDQHDRTSE